MKMKQVVQDMTDKVLFWALGDKNADLIEKATEVFLKGSSDRNDMMGFNDWLVHDYRDDQNRSLVSIYAAENPVSENERAVLFSIETSVFSAFERMPIQDKVVFKDLFTKFDYALVDEVEGGGVILARIYTFKGQNFILEAPEYLTEDYRGILIKGMLEKYNEYCRLFSPIQIEAFVKGHSQILYRFLNIIDSTAAEHSLSDHDYVVHQSTYIIKDRTAVQDILLGSGQFQLMLEDSAGVVIKMIQNESDDVLAEIVVVDDRLEIECISEEALEFAKNAVEMLTLDEVTHLRDEIVSLDDLL